MKVLTRGFAVAVVMSGAAIGFAGQAYAEPLSGTYTATPVPGGTLAVFYPSTTYTFNPCGSDCTRLLIGGDGGTSVDLHPQGDVWSGTWVGNSGISCTESVRSDATSTSRTCSGAILDHQLSKT